ncbi:hypothetical protein ACIA6D_15530 [Streptomyces cacaoi]
MNHAEPHHLHDDGRDAVLRAPTATYVRCPRKTEETERIACRNGALAGNRSRKPLPTDAVCGAVGGSGIPARAAASSSPVAYDAKGEPRDAAERPPAEGRGPETGSRKLEAGSWKLEATVAHAGDDPPRRLPNAGGQRSGRTNGECPAVGDRTVVDGPEVILHGRTGEADEALTRR